MHFSPFANTGSGVTDYRTVQEREPMIDFPINWLPPDNTLTLVYDNILGLGISSLDFFALPDVPIATTEVGDLPSNTLATELVPSTMLPQQNTLPVTKGQSPSWHMTPSDTGSGCYMSPTSPLTVTHNISSHVAPGGLYATRVHGARMPCTVRARQKSRLIPGAKIIKPVTERNCLIAHDQIDLEFPDTKHISVGPSTSETSSSFPPVPTIRNEVYSDIRKEFDMLCCKDSSIGPAFTNTRFPALSTLDMFIRLYFENFDEMVPIFHDQVASINVHWLLALAVSAIGCQYAEADEFSRSIRPLHEFLRRAILVATNSREYGGAGVGEREIVLVHAMTLNHIGMLYFGCPRLLRLARAQHGTLIEVARTLASSVLASLTHMKTHAALSDSYFLDIEWKRVLSVECLRRIFYTMWVSRANHSEFAHL